EVRSQAQLIGPEDLDRAFRVLMATESDVARVPYPKLVLEMALIKLATLAPVMPIEDLLQRLDDLKRGFGEGRPTGTETSPARTAQQPPAKASSPLSPTTSGARPAPELVARAAPEPTGQSWTDFLTFVGREKLLLLPYLQSSQSPALSEAELVL